MNSSTKFFDRSKANELSDAVSAEQLKKVGMDQAAGGQHGDEGFIRLRPYLRPKRRPAVSVRIVKKLA